MGEVGREGLRVDLDLAAPGSGWGWDDLNDFDLESFRELR